MDQNELLLKVDPDLSFSVNTQIKEQLKWLIGIGRIKPGDMLPSASQLADLLHLNRNTVNWVYNQLRDEGLVTMQKGRGTQVANGAETEQLRRERLPMERILIKTIEEAKTGGINLNALFVAGLAYTLLSNNQPSGRLRILFVECRGHDHLFYRGEIQRVTGGEVKTAFLEDLIGDDSRGSEAVHHSDVVVTTLNHAEEVRKLFSRYDKKIIVIGAAVDTAFLLEMARLKPETSVSFVCLGKTGGEWMATRVRDAGISQIRSDAFGLDERQPLSNALERSDKIYASSAVFAELKALAPEKTALFPMQLEKSSENLLKEIAQPASI
ncbi:GntR family transcriptional regulator [Paenibacillus caui]|uniref:GntR family transcriptional regulator n=1 Tax=Paenibacillus caui TaxID=2873927 RepID=UPI001CA97676